MNFMGISSYTNNNGIYTAIEKKNTQNNSVSSSIFSKIPIDVILEKIIIPYFSDKDIIRFGWVNNHHYSFISDTINRINKNRLSRSICFIDNALSEVKHISFKLAKMYNKSPFEVATFYKQLRQEKFEMVDFLSSAVAFIDLARLAQDHKCELLEMTRVMSGLKNCLSFFESNSSNNSIKDWLLEAAASCEGDKVEFLLRWYLEIYYRLIRAQINSIANLEDLFNNEEQDNEESYNEIGGSGSADDMVDIDVGNDLDLSVALLPKHLLDSANTPLFLTENPDQHLLEFFRGLIKKNNISIVAELFKNMGSFLLEHPLLNPGFFDVPISLPMFITSLISQRAEEKEVFSIEKEVIRYIEQEEHQDRYVKDIFMLALKTNQFNQSLILGFQSINKSHSKQRSRDDFEYRLVVCCFEQAAEIKLSCEHLRDRFLNYLIEDVFIPVMFETYQVDSSLFENVRISDSIKKLLLAEASHLAETIQSQDIKGYTKSLLQRYEGLMLTFEGIF
jgi:hypothetical protein